MDFISRECSWYLNSGNVADLQKYQTLSGLGFNKLGFYQDCIADKNNSFYLLSGTTQLRKSMGWSSELLGSFSDNFVSGICFNKVCSADDLQYVLTTINGYISLPFEILKVEEPNEMELGFNAPTVIILLILGVLAAVLSVCTVLDVLARLKKMNKSMGHIKVFSLFNAAEVIGGLGERSGDRIGVMNGVKALSLFGIFVTHVATIVFYTPTTSIYSQTSDGAFFIAFYAADVWLMVTGFFLSFLLLKQHVKTKNTKSLWWKIPSRLMRLWFLSVIAVLINWYVLPLVGSGGPLWPFISNFPERSTGRPYSHFLMLSNLLQDHSYNWLWLLQLDFQLFLCFVPLLVLYLRAYASKSALTYTLFYGIQAIFLFGSIGVGLLMDSDEFDSQTEYFFFGQHRRWNKLPITRAGGFVLGFNLGIAYFRFRRKKRKDSLWIVRRLKVKLWRILLPLLGFGSWYGISWVLHMYNVTENEIGPTECLIFASFRTLIPLCLVLIVLPSLYGFESPIKSLLQLQVLKATSKMSLAIYIIHYSFGVMFAYNRQSDLELSNFAVIFFSICAVLPSVAVAVFLMASIQLPLFSLRQKIFKQTVQSFNEH